ncbi:MAG: SIS domain-containing protein [Planctomycetes bacterium]|nr:SIS domain-containing protein [Planctomycetota bacterium]
MTKCLDDILRQPGELRKCLDNVTGSGFGPFMRGAAILRDAPDLYIAGIGASWSAGMGAQAFFSQAGRAASLVDAAELLHQPTFRPGSAILLLSRSGKSIEVVTLLDRAAKAGAKVVGVTNAPDSPLGKRSDAAILLGIGFDHAISVVTYSTVALAAGLVAAAATNTLGDLQALYKSIDALPAAIASWRGKLEGNAWFSAELATYFLARLGSLASAHESRLMWEETAKAPASALTTGGFRHGPQEIVAPGLRVGLWIDGKTRREEDFALARDLRKLGARVMTIGQGVPADAGDLVFEQPPIPAPWQFVTDIIPAQLAAEHLSRLKGVDCDRFRLSSHVVTKEGGLL